MALQKSYKNLQIIIFSDTVNVIVSTVVLSITSQAKSMEKYKSFLSTNESQFSRPLEN
jgi:hypothetical protein